MRYTVLLLALAACHRSTPVLTGPPDVIGSDADTCHVACTRLEQNGCAGISEPGCTDNCERDQVQGVATQLDPSAVLRATTIEQLAAIAGAPCTGTQ